VRGFFRRLGNFESASTEYQKIIQDKNSVNDDSSTWMEAVNQSLIIAIRVKHDQALALSVVKNAAATEGAPYYFRDNALAWKRSLEAWSPQKKPSEKTLWNDAKYLFALAKKQQKFSSDHSTDILYIIASSDLSDYLAMAPNSKLTSEALLMEGICEENISSVGFETLPILFYEECILKSPHTPIAGSCFHEYERESYFGFTGSSGTHFPNEIKQKLARLKILSSD
jgi:hypothetical protein